MDRASDEDDDRCGMPCPECGAELIQMEDGTIFCDECDYDDEEDQ